MSASASVPVSMSLSASSAQISMTPTVMTKANLKDFNSQNRTNTEWAIPGSASSSSTSSLDCTVDPKAAVGAMSSYSLHGSMVATAPAARCKT
eukprot:5235557-Karenia_brevis.AAC.1